MPRIPRVLFRRGHIKMSMTRPRISADLAGLFTACSLMMTAEARQQPAAQAVAAAPHRALVNRYCLSCHSDRLKTGGLALEGIAALDVDQNPDAWEKVLKK